MLITVPVAIAMVRAVADAPFAPGPGSASLSLYTGPVPTSAAAALNVAQNRHVCSFEFEDSMFGPAAQIGGSGVVEAALSTTPAQEALDAGDISFFRIYGTDGEPTHQGEVSENMAEAMSKLIVNQKTVTVGAEVRVLRLVIGTNID